MKKNRTREEKLRFWELCPRKLAKVNSVTSGAAMSRILALPPPSPFANAAALSGVARLRQILASDATPFMAAVAERRRRADAGVENDSTRRNRRVAGSSRRDGAQAIKKALENGTLRIEDFLDLLPDPLPSLLFSLVDSTTGFLTQSIAQEVIGSGLHIEPWDEAINAYRQASMGPSEPLVSNVST